VSESLSFDESGPWLIGRDVARLCGERTVSRVTTIVRELLRDGDAGPLGRLVERAFGDWDGRYAEVHRRFEVLCEALSEGPSE